MVDRNLFSILIYVCVQRKCAERDGLRAVCKASPVKAPGPDGFTGLALHAALSLAQHHSAWWPESADLYAALASEATKNSRHPNLQSQFRFQPL